MQMQPESVTLLLLSTIYSKYTGKKAGAAVPDSFSLTYFPAGFVLYIRLSIHMLGILIF